MNYVTTNIRISEYDYLKLKEEAAKRRMSLSAVIRERIKTEKKRSHQEVVKLIRDLDKLAKKNAKKLKSFDSVKSLRQIRYEGKW